MGPLSSCSHSMRATGSPVDSRVSLTWGRVCCRKWESHGGCGAQWAGEGPFQNPGPHGPKSQVLPMSKQYCQFPGVPARIPGSCSPRASLPTLCLDQDKLELELVLKGSYEDTQTSVLGPASAFRFHYMAAQEGKLSARVRVGPGFTAPCHGPAPAAAGPSWANARPLWSRQPPPERHQALGR